MGAWGGGATREPVAGLPVPAVIARHAALIRPLCDMAAAAGVALLLVGGHSAVASPLTAVGLGLSSILNPVRSTILLRAALVTAAMTLVVLRDQQAGVVTGVEITRVLLVISAAVSCAVLAERRPARLAYVSEVIGSPADRSAAWRHDPLAFERLLARTTGRFAVVSVGVDNLALVSRLWGEDVAAAAVRSVDRVLMAWGIAHGVPVAHVQRDEFAVILPNAGLAAVNAAAERLLLDAAATSDDGLRASISVGWAFGGDAFAGDAGPAATWAEARGALGLARERGGGGVLRAGEQRAADIIPANPLQRLVATIPIRATLEPVVDLANGGVLAVEALARLVSFADHGSITELFTAAREIGAIAELEDVCRLAGVAAFARVPLALPVHLNVAMVGSGDGAEVGAAELADLVDTIGRPASSVVLGLTDGGYLDPAAIVDMAAAYRDRGFLLAIDGAADLDTFAWLLHHLHPTVMRVDRTLVGRTVFNAGARHQARELIAAATDLGVLVVAKAIETQEMLDRVLAMGITAGQGRLLSAEVGMAARRVTAASAA